MSATATHRLGPPDGEGPTLTTTVRLAASGGRADRVRISLTVIGSAVATVMLLTAASVAFITSTTARTGSTSSPNQGCDPE